MVREFEQNPIVYKKIKKGNGLKIDIPITNAIDVS